MFDSKMNEAKQARNMEGGEISDYVRNQAFPLGELKNNCCFVRFKQILFITDPSSTEESFVFEKKYLSLEDYDCIGFDLDHTLCRYNVGPMIRYLLISYTKYFVNNFPL